MLSGFLKFWVRLALPFFAKNIHISGTECLKEKGPLVLALNHPNSFLDAVLLGAFMEQPVHFLARGDVFRIGWVRAILTRINMLPVYRIRDGKDKLNLNEQTFERSREVLEKNGILLVFVEGFCEHQTTLQLPLKKGAPRVIEACWRKGVPVKILPIWLQYSSFTGHPKTIEIRFGDKIGRPPAADGKEPNVVWQMINEHTSKALLALEQKPSQPVFPLPTLLRILLAIPAILGAVLHAPLYLPVQALVRHATRNNVHYDSVLFAVLLLLYPVYLLTAAVLLASTTSFVFMLLPLIVLPLTARCYVLWK
jgi:1-acyl-sn-glycerol-3-phosphate acyltransferase